MDQHHLSQKPCFATHQFFQGKWVSYKGSKLFLGLNLCLSHLWLLTPISLVYDVNTQAIGSLSIMATTVVKQKYVLILWIQHLDDLDTIFKSHDHVAGRRSSSPPNSLHTQIPLQKVNFQMAVLQINLSCPLQLTCHCSVCLVCTC
jgi:hypothetical protein